MSKEAMRIRQKDLEFMQRTITLARRGAGKTSPNPMVGSVLVRGGRIIAEGWHRRSGGDHAEIIALKKAGSAAWGSQLYINLEPCSHYGKTPPCVDEIIKSGVKEVILGMKDPNPLTNGKSIKKLRRAGIKTRIGILEQDAQELNEAFNKYIKYRMPFVVSKSAQTLDGKIATASGHSRWITSRETRNYSHRLRDQFDAILVGSQTILKDDPCLNAASGHKRIKKIIVDSTLKITPKAKLFSWTLPEDCFLATTRLASLRKIKLFQNKGINVIVCPSHSRGINLKWLFKELAKREIVSILIEGGAHIIGSALRDDLVDKMLFFLAPKLIGDVKALNSVIGLHCQNINRSVVLRNLKIEKIYEECLISGYVLRNR